ncbi:unnamed protein product [Calypogeia fissa]
MLVVVVVDDEQAMVWSGDRRQIADQDEKEGEIPPVRCRTGGTSSSTVSSPRQSHLTTTQKVVHHHCSSPSPHHITPHQTTPVQFRPDQNSQSSFVFFFSSSCRHPFFAPFLRAFNSAIFFFFLLLDHDPKDALCGDPTRNDGHPVSFSTLQVLTS